MKIGFIYDNPAAGRMDVLVCERVQMNRCGILENYLWLAGGLFPLEELASMVQPTGSVSSDARGSAA